jgi:hypothetical protein
MKAKARYHLYRAGMLLAEVLAGRGEARDRQAVRSHLLMTRALRTA